MSRRGRLAAIPAIVTLGFGVGFATEPAKIAEESRVTVVEVPVYATDRDGRPVEDLKPEEFILLEDGKPQEILFAQRVVAGLVPNQPASPGAESVETMAMQRHFVLVFDLSFNTLSGLKNARESAWRFVAEKLAPGDKVAVFSISQSGGLRMCANFTSDRERLRGAIADLRGTDMNGLLAESAGLVEKPVDATQKDVEAPSLGTAPTLEDGMEEMLNSLAPQVRDHLAHVQRFDRFTLRKSACNYLDMLRSLAQSLNVLPGRKIVVLFSAGFNASQVFFNEEGAATGGTMLNLRETIDTTAGQADTLSLDTAKKAMGYFSTSDCRLYTVDTAGMAANEEADTARTSQDSLAMLAEEAGGKFFKASTASTEILDLIEDETREYYLLAYSPPPRADKGDYHEIVVKVSRPGLDIMHRKGYYDQKPFNEYSPLERDLQLAEVLLNDRVHAEITFSAVALGFPTRTPAWDGFTQVLLHVSLSGEANRDVLGERLEVVAFALTDDGRIADFFRSKQWVSDEGQMKRIRTAGLTYADQLLLRPGEYELKVIVRNAQTGATGTQDMRIAVPDFSRAAFFMATPCFISLNSEPVNVSALQAKNSITRYKDFTATYPLVVNGKAYPPVIVPDVLAQPVMPLFFKLYNFRTDPATGKPRVHVACSIRGLENQSRMRADCTLKHCALDPDGAMEMMFEFKALQLEKGDYVLVLEAEDQTEGAKVTGSIMFRAGEPVASIPSS